MASSGASNLAQASLRRYRAFAASRLQLLQRSERSQSRSSAVEFRRMWTDKGMRSPSQTGLSFWRPIPPDGYVALGELWEVAGG